MARAKPGYLWEVRSALAPFLLVIALPALVLLARRGWLATPRARGLAWGAFAVGALSCAPWDGVDFVYLHRTSGLLAGAAALLLWLAHRGVPPASTPRFQTGALGALAALAVLVHVNFFSFHGERTFVHLHDVAHYHLGAKYYDELGYADLYTAMLRAEAERYDDHFKAIEARDLETYQLVHIRNLLERSGPVKAAFSAERWTAFVEDVAWFRDRLGPHYATVLEDHGFNATPVWLLFGWPLANLVPAGSHAGILALCLIDPLLIAATFALLARTFGLRLALIAAIEFCVLFGATFGWKGGSFLREAWLLCLVAAVCGLARGRYATAGGWLALASGLRLFPVVFAVPLAVEGAMAWRRTGRLTARTRRFFTAFAIAGGALCLATAVLPRGFEHWLDMQRNLANHVANISPNVVGLTELLAWQSGPATLTAPEFSARLARRQRIHQVQLAVALPLLLGWLGLRLRREGADLVWAVAAGLPLLLASLSLAGYDYVFLLVAVVAFRSDPGRLALVFAVEAASYTLMLFEDREALLYIYRSGLLVWLYATLFARSPADPGSPAEPRAPRLGSPAEVR